MPLKLNIGLSKKVGDANYGSRGATVNVEVEVESALANDPAKLQERIRKVFNLVRSSVEEELNGSHGSTPAANGNANGQRSSPPPNGNGYAQRTSVPPPNNNGRNGKQRPATLSQVKAIRAIANRQAINLDKLLRDRFNINKPDDLSIGDASSLIDELKSNGS